MAFKVMNIVNKVTRLNKAFFDTLQSNIKNAIDNIENGTQSIAYDNTNSDLKSTNLKSAIDELANRNVYSTEEIVVGTWIDKKPIYRKVIEFTFGTSISATGQIIANVSNIDNIITTKGYFRDKAKYGYPIPVSTDDNNMGIYYNPSSENFYAYHSNSYANNGICHAILEYTKTTD